MNEDKYPKNVHIRLIDFNQTFGAFIDREENKERVVRRVAQPMFRKNVENFDIYMPDKKSWGDQLTLNFEMLLRIETNLKLNIIDRNGKSLIENNDKLDEEVHFLRFESVYSTYEINLKSLWRLAKESMGKIDLQFSNWTITDID